MLRNLFFHRLVSVPLRVPFHRPRALVHQIPLRWVVATNPNKNSSEKSFRKPTAVGHHHYIISHGARGMENFLPQQQRRPPPPPTTTKLVAYMASNNSTSRERAFSRNDHFGLHFNFVILYAYMFYGWRCVPVWGGRDTDSGFAGPPTGLNRVCDANWWCETTRRRGPCNGEMKICEHWTANTILSNALQSCNMQCSYLMWIVVDVLLRLYISHR